MSGGLTRGDCTDKVERGSYCTPTCKTGFQLVGKSSCSMSGVSSEAACKGSVCDFSNPPLHGRVGDCTSAHATNTECHPSCDGAYVLSGPSRCDLSGHAFHAKCEAPCFLPETLANVSVCAGNKTVVQSQTSCGRLDSLRVGYSCSSPGLCLDGTWQNLNDAICKPEKCVLASSLEEASVSPNKIFCNKNGRAAGVTDACVCRCHAGFSGTLCEMNVDDCVDSPCLNNGICIDGTAGYSCECQLGYTGPHW